jgi:N-hydroxyarylamine O-acetyltransferase
VKPYLERIGVGGFPLSADFPTLKLLQRSHLLAVPFENLDIHWKRPIELDTKKFYAKIVERKRGGFCYELNGLFNSLLSELGFRTRLISGRVFNGTEHGPEFDHAAIIVTIGADEYLADVGFGAFAAEPLRFVLDEEQADLNGTFVIRKFDHDYFEVARFDSSNWVSEYIFRDAAHELSEFKEMCDFQQYSPESHFRKGKLCSIMINNGRKTLTDRSFVVTTDGVKQDTPITDDADFYARLRSEFGIEAAQV